MANRHGIRAVRHFKAFFHGKIIHSGYHVKISIEKLRLSENVLENERKPDECCRKTPTLKGQARQEVNRTVNEGVFQAPSAYFSFSEKIKQSWCRVCTFKVGQIQASITTSILTRFKWYITFRVVL